MHLPSTAVPSKSIEHFLRWELVSTHEQRATKFPNELEDPTSEDPGYRNDSASFHRVQKVSHLVSAMSEKPIEQHSRDVSIVPATSKKQPVLLQHLHVRLKLRWGHSGPLVCDTFMTAFVVDEQGFVEVCNIASLRDSDE